MTEELRVFKVSNYLSEKRFLLSSLNCFTLWDENRSTALVEHSFTFYEVTDSGGQVWREARHHCIDTDRQYPLLAGSFVTCACPSQNEQPSSEKLRC